MGGATILHMDLDAFYVSVEQRDRPELRGKAVAVGRGVVLSASYEARRMGVRSGMPGGQARKLCPRLISVSGRFSEYVDASRQVFEICRRFTPLVEPVSIDEAFMEVKGAGRIHGEPAVIARKLRADIAAEVGLPASVGVARTKFLAKVGSRVAKPDGMVVVEPPDEVGFLHALTVDYLWGVGPATQQRLAAYGIETIRQLAEIPADVLGGLLGPGIGRHLHALAWNRDPRGVTPHRRASSVGAQSALGGKGRARSEWGKVLLDLAERVGSRLRAKDREARALTLRVRYPDFTSASRRRTFPAAMSSTDALYRGARKLLAGLMEGDERPLTLLGIAASQLRPAGPLQLELPLGPPVAGGVLLGGSAEDMARRDLDAAVDALRDRMGREVVERATLAGRDPRWDQALREAEDR